MFVSSQWRNRGHLNETATLLRLSELGVQADDLLVSAHIVVHKGCASSCDLALEGAGPTIAQWRKIRSVLMDACYRRHDKQDSQHLVRRLAGGYVPRRGDLGHALSGADIREYERPLAALRRASLPEGSAQPAFTR
jgi:hypothetical protein